MAILSVEEALTYKVIHASAVSALIGPRFHPLRLPDTATLPAATYQEISNKSASTMDETPGSTLICSRYQIDSWATSHKVSREVSKAIFAVLHGYKGQIVSGFNTFTFQVILRVSRRSNHDPETGLYWTSQDFMVWYTE